MISTCRQTFRASGERSRPAGAGARGVVVRRDDPRVDPGEVLALARLILVEQLRLAPQVRVERDLVLQLVRQLVEDLGRGHLGGAVGASVGDAEEPQFERVDDRGHPPLGHGRPRAEELREPRHGWSDVHRRPPRERVGDLGRPLAEVDVPGEARRIGGEEGEVVQDLLILQLGERRPLVDRPLPEPGGRTARQGQDRQRDEEGNRAHVPFRGVDSGGICRRYRPRGLHGLSARPSIAHHAGRVRDWPCQPPGRAGTLRRGRLAPGSHHGSRRRGHGRPHRRVLGRHPQRDRRREVSRRPRRLPGR